MATSSSNNWAGVDADKSAEVGEKDKSSMKGLFASEIAAFNPQADTYEKKASSPVKYGDSDGGNNQRGAKVKEEERPNALHIRMSPLDSLRLEQMAYSASGDGATAGGGSCPIPFARRRSALAKNENCPGALCQPGVVLIGLTGRAPPVPHPRGSMMMQTLPVGRPAAVSSSGGLAAIVPGDLSRRHGPRSRLHRARQRCRL